MNGLIEVMIIGFLIVIVIYFSLYLISLKRKKRFKSITFKIAKISDNLDNDNYKIVGRAKDGSFLELLELMEFRYIKDLKIFSPKVINYAYCSWENKEDAEKELNKFRIAIDQLQYEKKIEIID